MILGSWVGIPLPVSFFLFFLRFSFCSSFPMSASIARVGQEVASFVPRPLSFFFFMFFIPFFIPYERVNARVKVRGFVLFASIPFLFLVFLPCLSFLSLFLSLMCVKGGIRKSKRLCEIELANRLKYSKNSLNLIY